MARIKAAARMTGARTRASDRQRRLQQAQATAVIPSASSNTRVLRSDTAKAASASKVTKPKTRRRRLDPWTSKRKVNPNPTPRPRAPRRTHFTCRICIEEQSTDEFIEWVPPRRRRWTTLLDVPLNCIAHLGRNPRKTNIDPVCKSCIGNAMSARLDTLGARKVGVGCLEPGCSEIWNHDFVMRYYPPGEPLEKYNMEMLNVWMEDATPKPMTCLSPTCNAIGLPDVQAAGYPQITCYECSFRSCAQCLVPWHKDVTCAEFSAKRVDEKMSDPEKDTLKLMQTRDGKRCPNCQLVIEKDGGCDSMFCTGCHKYFNWATAASAVFGAKKAEPITHNGYLWQANRTVGCEMDLITENTGSAGAPVAAAAS